MNIRGNLPPTSDHDDGPDRSRSDATLVNDDAPVTMSRPALIAVAGRQLLAGGRVLLAMTVIVGLLYPLLMFGIGRLLPDRADGSLVEADGRIVGSALIGQQFTGDEWFHGRPSAAGAGYDALASGGSNLAADSEELAEQVAQRRAELAAANGVDPADVPADAVTASASGLDPDISPAYARLQIHRVALARGLEVDRVQQLVQEHTRGRDLGFIGEPRVAVLELNLALERLTS